MKILKEQIDLINKEDLGSIIDDLKNELFISLKKLNPVLKCVSIPPDILRIYYESKPICDIVVDYMNQNDLVFIIEDYLGNKQVVSENRVIDTIENLILALNLTK